MAEVISVSALNQYVKTLLDANDLLFDLALRGEIANFVQNARSGHCYFSLRDETSSVKAVMFRSDARRLGFRPEEGMKVIVRCRATLYERDGAFQVYVNDMFPDGIGSTQLAFEQLKAKLDKEGLFAPEHKKPIPYLSHCGDKESAFVMRCCGSFPDVQLQREGLPRLQGAAPDGVV